MLEASIYWFSKAFSVDRQNVLIRERCHFSRSEMKASAGGIYNNILVPVGLAKLFQWTDRMS